MTTTAEANLSTETRAPLTAWVSLAILLGVGLYTYMDRQIFGLQSEPLRKALGLSDLQFGLIQGVSVALFTMVVGYPIAWLSDRFDRRRVLAVCIAIWSLSVAACGLSADFPQLFMASAMVGAAEAGLLPITYALIPELFMGRQRQVANSALVVAARLLVGAVVALCGWMIYAIDLWRPLLPVMLQDLPTWRLAFFATALPGIVFVPLILMLPIPKAPSAASATSASAPRAAVLPFLRANAFTYTTFMLGVGLLVFGFGATGAFIPVVAMRQMGMSPKDLGSAMGIATFVAAAVGLLITAGALKRLTLLFGALLPIRMLMIASLGSAGFAALLVLAQTPFQLFALMALHQTFLMAGMMLFPTALQEMTPTPIRARLISLVIMFNVVVGSLSPVVVGALSDALKPRPDGLLLAMALTATAALLLSGVSLTLCARRFKATTDAARATERLLDQPVT